MGLLFLTGSEREERQNRLQTKMLAIMHQFDFIDIASVKVFLVASFLWIFGDLWPSGLADGVKLLGGIVFVSYNLHRWYVFHQEQKNKKQ